MEIYEAYLKKAYTHFKTADHLAYITLPLINDKKLMAVILDNLSRALNAGMNTLLEYERLYKRILPLANTFEARYEVFKSRELRRYGFINEEIQLILELRRFMEARKESPVEFTRSNKFIICSDNYKMKTVSLEEIKKYLSITKNFLLKINKAVGK